VDPGLDRADRHPEHAGDLFIRQVLLVPQQDGRPRIGRQLLDEGVEPASQLALLDLLVGTIGRVLELDRPFLAGGALLGLGERDELRPVPPVMIDAQPGGDRVQPGPERPRRVVAGEGAEGPQERLLRQVLGILGPPQDAQAQPVDLAQVALDQEAVGVRVVLEASAHQARVVGLPVGPGSRGHRPARPICPALRSRGAGGFMGRHARSRRGTEQRDSGPP